MSVCACIILIFCHPDDHKGGRISGTPRRVNIRLTQVDVHEILRRNAPLDDKMFKGRIRHTTDTSTPTAKRCVSLLKGPLPAFSGEALRNFCSFPLRRKSCLSDSEFFFFRERVKILASEREPALFLFVSFSFVRTKGKRKALRLGLMFSFCFARCLWIGFCRLYFHAISNKALPNA